MPRVKVSRKGSIVIPKEIRDRFGIHEGMEVSLQPNLKTITLVPVPPGDPVERLYGMFKGGRSLTEALLEDRRWELEREERDSPPPRSAE